MPQRSRHLLLLAPLAAAPLLAGCGDNPSCVFTTGCQGGGGGIGAGDPASLPVDGQTIASAQPTIEDVQPDGGQASSTTPILVTFSESMAPDTNQGKLELVQLDVGGFPLGAVPTTQVLVAKGRALLILPAAALLPADYTVQVAADADLFDLTGQRLALADEAILASFLVDTEDPDEPEVVATFPGDEEIGPTTSPVVFVFDRPMDAATFTQSSFVVEVDGAPPAFDPLPVPLSVDTDFVPLVDTRIFLWQSLDTATGAPASLGTNAQVVFTLSPLGSPIEDAEDVALAPFSTSFRTQPIEAPIAVSLLSTPTDGIGIRNLTPGDPEELALQIDLSAAEPGDVAIVTMFGLQKDVEEGEEPILIALERTKEAAGTSPITAVSFSLEDLDLITDPGVARFGDGTVAFACALRRGNATTPVRLLDVDGAPGIQDPLLDTVAPTVLELLKPGIGVTAEFRSDVRDLTLAGRASEPVRSAEVSTPLGDTGVLPEILGSDEDGFFLAASLPLGLIGGGGPVDYELTVYDAVFNPSPAVPGVFTQHGAVDGSAGFTPGQPIEVEVVDAITLAPLQGALVATHADQGDGVTFPLVDSDATTSAGTATVDSAAPPAVGTLLTVDLAGYDLWTFHGIAAGRVSVTLRPTLEPMAAVGGVVTTTSDLAELTLADLKKKFDDARRPEGVEPTFDGQTCVADPFGTLPLNCPFGPEPVAAERLGALSFLAGNLLLTEGAYSPSALIQAFQLVLPRPPAAATAVDDASFSVPFLLTEPGHEEELPLDAPAVTFFGALATGLDLGNLTDDPLTTGVPRVTLETLVPGVPGAVAVGLGLAFDGGGVNVWTVRSAFPAAVTLQGFYGSKGAVDDDLFLRVELRDAAGTRSGQRPRLSTLEGLPLPFGLFAPPVPVISAPAAGATVTTAAFEVGFANSIPDVAGEPGLYAVRLTDATGRGWDLLLPDPPDGAPAAVHVPDLLPLGGSRLAEDEVLASVAGYAWPGFDAGLFMLSDVEREHDLFASGAPILFTYDPTPSPPR